MPAIQNPPNKEQGRQDNTPAPLIVRTLQRENDVLTLQRHRKWHRPLAGWLSAKGLFSSPETRHAPNRQPGGASVPPRDGEF